MFEKEAEEWRNSLNYEIDNDTFNNIVIPCIEFGYNKANEWHFVKDGDLPKTKKRVLVLLKDVEEPILDYYRQDGLWNYALENEVIAWKEIILPEPFKYWDLSTGENNINKED